MAFKVGAEVVVTGLQKRGRILEVAANGRYRVAIGALTVWCSEGDLTTVSQGKKGARRARATPVVDGGSPAPFEREADRREIETLRTLDLHGMTVEEALRAVEARLDRAIRAGLDRIEIIQGISGGRLRAAVRGYLAGIGSVARVAPDPRNPGVTWVYL